MAGGCRKDSCPLREHPKAAAILQRAGCLAGMILLLVNLTGCVAATVGVVAGTAVAVGTAAVKVPVKAGGAVIGAVTSDDDEDEEDD
jgi:hypothetical protein